MKNLTQKFVFSTLLLLTSLGGVQKMQAQCDFNTLAVTKKDATCSNNGQITVSVSGNCNSAVKIRKTDDSSFERSEQLMAADGISTAVFANLEPASYSMSYFTAGGSEVAYAQNPVVIGNSYVPMRVSSTNTQSSCADMPDGELTITVASATGMGPFVYSLTTPRGTQTSSSTTDRTHTFGAGDNDGVISGETVSFTVTDLKNDECSASVTQTPIIATGTFGSLLIGISFLEESATVCNQFGSIFRFHLSGGGKSISKQREMMKIAGNATIEVTPADGSAPYSQNLTYDETIQENNQTNFYMRGPAAIKPGDRYTIRVIKLCGGETTVTRTIANPVENTLDINSTGSTKTVDADCNIIETIRFQYGFYNNIPYFSDPNRTLKLYRKNPDGSWTETAPKSGTLHPFTRPFPDNQSTIIYLNDWGTYKLVYEDRCRTFDREFTITEPVVRQSVSFSYPYFSIHGNTGGVRMRVNNFNYADSLTVTINATDGIPEKTWEISEAFSDTKRMETVRFPLTFKIKVSSDQSIQLADFPVGSYKGTVTDKCDNIAEYTFSVQADGLLTYSPKNTEGYENGVQIRHGCSNSNSIYLDYASQSRERAYVSLYKNNISVGGVAYDDGTVFNNLEAGNYTLKFNSFNELTVAYSLVLKRFFSSVNFEVTYPVVIRPYSELAITNNAAMCNPAAASSGLIDVRLTDGTPVYPVRYQLFNKGTSDQIAEYIDNTQGSKNHVFSGISQGEYDVRVTNGYDAGTAPNGCGQTSGSVVVSGNTIPEIEKSRDNVYVDDNQVTLSIPISPNIYTITWYDGDGTQIGTGSSIEVMPSPAGVHSYKAIVELNSTATLCSTAFSQERTVSITVLNRNYWHGGNGTTIAAKESWADAQNWTANRLPMDNETVEFATVANYGSEAVNNLRMDASHRVLHLINQTQSRALIIPPATTLTVSEKATVRTANQLMIESAANQANGSIVFASPEQNTAVPATVQMYSKAFKGTPVTWVDNYPNSPTTGQTYTTSYRWQYFGIPVKSVTADPTFSGSFVRQYEESKNDAQFFYQKWVSLANGSVLVPFKGYEITQNAPKIIWFQGELVTGDTRLNLTKTEGYMGGFNLFGNSYAAAIDIAWMQFGANVEATVYLYNTGSFSDWGGQHTTSGQIEQPGSYYAIPQNATEILQREIPSMQGFALYTAVNNGEVMIPYNKTTNVATPNTRSQRVGGTAADSQSDISHIVVDVIGNSGSDRVWLIEQAGTSAAFDNGWDGYKLSTSNQLAIYATEEVGNLQVNTVNDLNGRYLTLRTAQAGDYTLRMNLENYKESAGKELFIIDLSTGIETLLHNGTTTEYHFTASENVGVEKRFLLGMRQAVATGGTLNAGTLDVKVFVREEKVWVQNNTAQSAIAWLMDVTGKQIATAEIPPQSTAPLSANVPTGTYLVKISAANNRFTTKVMINAKSKIGF